MSAPLVSVVIPAYNHSSYVGQAIESVLVQDYPRIELIAIDDGSTDATAEVLGRYAGRATIIRQENRGQAATLNRGWSMAHGDFLGYLGADDVLESSAVSEAVGALTGNPQAVLAYPDFYLLDPQSRVIRTSRRKDFSYRDLLVSVECPPGPGVLFRRDAFEAAGGWNEEYRQMPDYDYWLRLGLLGEFIHIPKALAGFRIHPESQTFAPTPEARAIEPVKIVSAMFASGRLPPDLVSLHDRALSNAQIFSAQLHLRAGRVAAAWSCVRIAAKLCAANLLTPRSARALLNALFNRIGHRLLWTTRRAIHSMGPRGSRPGGQRE